MIAKKLLLTLASVLTALLTTTRLPDEGMWTFENPPTKILKERYGFAPDAQWFDHLRVCSVRFNSGGSGSFVSPHGLVMTNHHVALESVQKLSSAANDYVKNGFLAATLADEIPCKDLELNVLMSFADVTERVKAAKNPQAESERIAVEENQKTGLRCDVTKLYNGGVYMVYRFKQFTDVRLVWAPELAVGFYGGDPDNFTYPRFNLDCSFFRVYEAGKPIQSPDHLRWSKDGCKEGDLVFVSGHPGTTNRLQTLATLTTYRDVIYPTVLGELDKRRQALRDYAQGGAEQAREIRDEMFGIENTFKALTGELDCLRDAAVMQRKQEQETAFLATEAGQKVKPAVEKIATVRAEYGRIYPLLFLSNLPGKLAELAQNLLEYYEIPAENAAARKTAELALFSSAPIYPGMEEVLLRTTFQSALDRLGAEHALVQTLLAGKTPAERATQLVKETKLIQVETRKKLAAAGPEGLVDAKEPFVELIGALHEAMQPLRQKVGPLLGTEQRLNTQIAEARFAAFGKESYPDATFTLRLAFGVVKGYEWGTTQIPCKTTFGGLYDRHDSFDGREPWRLPERALAARAKVDMSTPLNFVSTADIIGGNSGSPVVDRKGEVVGLIFDGNIQSLGGNFVYDERWGRSVAVDSRGILEALRKIYDAGKLADEITGGK